jgi:hypothetical protein
MNLRTWLIAATWAFLPLLSGAQQPVVKQQTAAESKTANAASNAEAAGVEDVVATEDDGFRASTYVVRWHGNRVLLVDPLASTHLAVGDTANFVISHQEIGGKRLLSFVFTGNKDCRCKDQQQPTTTPKSGDPGSASGGADYKTGIVEEVLSAEDDGYRAVGYIVQAQGARIAVADPLAQSHYSVGDTLSFLAVRTKFKDLSLLAFMAMPVNAGGAKATPPATSGVTPATGIVTAPQSGIIMEVLTASDANYSYRAYIVEALGTRVAVEDSPGASPHQVGEQLSFISRRIPNPLTSGHGLLSFGLPPQSDTAADPEGAHVSLRNDTATVDEILTTEVNGDRYVAYIVKWNGARIAISDVFASTHYAVGDRITFPVAHADAAGQRHLNFMMFNFVPPAPPPRKESASGSNEKPT